MALVNALLKAVSVLHEFTLINPQPCFIASTAETSGTKFKIKKVKLISAREALSNLFTHTVSCIPETLKN